MHYWSRSRQQLWLKGETSGHRQEVVSWFRDCDGDTLLFTVRQAGGACHTGYESCFFQRLERDGTLAPIAESPVSIPAPFTRLRRRQSELSGVRLILSAVRFYTVVSLCR
jgi:hypothetical protein